MKKHGVAILGFGVVGGGVANLLTNNRDEIKGYLGCEVEVRKILDLRDFPTSPFASLVTHSFDEVLADDGVDTVMEMMGEKPTASALRSWRACGADFMGDLPRNRARSAAHTA